MKTFLSAYTIRVDKKRGRNDEIKNQPDYCTLSCFNGHDDLYNVMRVFLQNLTGNSTNDTYKTYMKTIKLDPEGRSIGGVFESGIYGLSSNLRNVDTDSITYKKKKNEADVLPFYFLFYIPQDTNEGILLLQRTGRYGVRTNLGTFLNNFFLDKYPGFTIEINTLVQEEIIKKMLYNGNIKKLRCVKYHAPVDRFDGLDEGHEELPCNMEVVLSASRIPLKNTIKKFFASKSSVKTLVELRDFNFDYDTVKVDVEIEGSIRTFDLGRLFKARSNYDISDQVALDTDEHPTFASMQMITKSYLKEIIKQMYP
ncbi:hypothetical protein Q5692_29660 [Microcoleus sp. C2C3]|uniref:hypothetical protein n=1 Tax=unclassified Microcoleus TaxID=2642155 RepID=UPI002FD229F1